MFPWQSHTLVPGQFAAVRDTSLSKLVRDEVLGLILRGDLMPGARINEPDIALRLGISRVPVREALRELESSGLVVARKHAGVFVRDLDATEVGSLYALRALLDGYVGRCAAQLGQAARTALADALDASIALMQEAADALHVERYYAENLRFHWLMVEAADNLPLAEIYRGVVQQLHLARLKNLSKDLGMQASIAEHRDIAEALREGDAARCEALLTKHVQDAHVRLADSTHTTGMAGASG
jgi:DNA-binding GntR family transcriptional regulator